MGVADIVQRQSRLRLRPALEHARPIYRALRQHRLGTHAAAIAFRVLVGLVPLAILSIALLGTLGLEGTWSNSIAPEVRDRVTQPVFEAIDYSVKQIFESTRGGLIAFATLLLLWQLFRGVRAATVALNEIHDVEETRSGKRQLLLAIGLAFAVGACLVATTLVMVVAPRIEQGAPDVVLSLVRWPVAIALLGVAVGLLVRYAP